MIQIAFRFDDPSETSNHELEKSVIQLCCQYEISVNFAVIPYRKIEEQLIPFSVSKAAHLVEAFHAGYIEISQHGYKHINNAAPSKKYRSEFVGIELDQQLQWLKEGKETIANLFGEKPIGLVPPWNSFDVATIHVANRLNYSFISAGWEIPQTFTNAIPVIPRTSNLKNVMASIGDAQLFSELDPVIIVVLHHYDFEQVPDSVPPLVELEKLFQFINNNENISKTSLNKIAHQYNPALSAYNIKAYSDRQKLHWRIKRYFPENFIFINERVSTMKLLLMPIKNISYFSLNSVN